MKKPTKNIITRDFIEKELWFCNKASVRSSIIFLIMLLIFSILCTAMFIYLSCVLSKSILMKILLCIISVAIGTVFFWLEFIALMQYLSERKKLKLGKFEVVTRKVLYKRMAYLKRELSIYERYARRYKRECVFFEDFNHTIGYSSLLSEGDECYIVHYNGSREIKQLYPLNMYEYIEK